MTELAQVVEKDVVGGVVRKLVKGVAIGAVIFGVLAGLAFMVLMQLPTC